MRLERELTAPRVQVLRSRAELCALREEWGALHERSSASVFNAWEWLQPWLERLGADRTPYVLVAREGADGRGRLLGVLPLSLSVQRTGPGTVRRLGFLGDVQVGSDYLDVVAEKGREQEVTSAFAATLRLHSDDWDLLELWDLDEASGTPALLEQAFGAGFERRRMVRSTCPHERFGEGETFDQFLRRTRRRDNYLRRRKWLEKQPGYRVEVTTSPAELARPLAEFFRLHAMRWEEDGGSSGIRGPRTEAFHRDATALLAERGKVRLYTMWVGEVAVASVYGIVHGDRFHYYQSGLDPAWRPKSVGMVLVGATFEDALRLGLREYDFLRGTESYKADWVSRTRQTVGLRIFSRKGAGAFYVRLDEHRRALRSAVKRLLPAAWVERVRRFRR
jgi:CelD/BcsL family acetyltransferase involved in cellulose biosynthesis